VTEFVGLTELQKGSKKRHLNYAGRSSENKSTVVASFFCQRQAGGRWHEELSLLTGGDLWNKLTMGRQKKIM